MAKKAKAPKKGTYYEKNRKAVRTYQTQRRADIKAGRIVPKTGAGSGKGKIADVNKEPKKRDQSNRRSYKTKWARDNREKERIAFIEYYNNKYPPPKPD